MAKMYRVTAPYVTVRVNAPAGAGGETVLGFYEGGTLPDSAIQESVDVLLTKGMVEEIPAAEAKKLEKAEDDAEKQEAASEKAAADAAAKQKADDEAAAKKAADAAAKAAKA